MFRPIRRSQQALSHEDCEEILGRGTSGVLAVSGDDGWPYAVPLSYVSIAGTRSFSTVQKPAINWTPSGGSREHPSVS